MLRYVMMTVGLALAPVTAHAADLSGTWVRDGARSDVVPGDMYWLTRGVEWRGTRDANSNVVIVIDQNAQRIQINDPADPLRVYALDGAAHQIPSDTGVTSATVTAADQGNQVVIDQTKPYGGMPGNVGLSVHQTWQLAADNNTLTVTTVRTTPARQVTYNEVYTRQ